MQGQEAPEGGHAEHRLLVLYHKTAVVALPLQLAAHTIATPTQARNAVIHHVTQLIAFSRLDEV